jgi:8-oxo-dGTP pyrophosphatase MutT (NUDIX family)
MPAAPRPAATVVLLRPEPEGDYTVFLVQRNRTVGFMPNAWVFPGGRVDDRDRMADNPAVRGGDAAVAALGLDRADAVAILVGAAREVLEETGLWLGSGAFPTDARRVLAAGAIDLPSLMASHAATLDLDSLVPWAWWVTPEVEPKRFDTRFLLAVAPPGDALHDDGETVASQWLRPADAVARAEAGELAMAPPTWWTLRELMAHRTLAEVMTAAKSRPNRPIQPVARFPDGQFELVLPGHADHPEPAFPGLPTLVKFVQGRWWADGVELASVPRIG